MSDGRIILYTAEFSPALQVQTNVTVSWRNVFDVPGSDVLAGSFPVGIDGKFLQPVIINGLEDGKFYYVTLSACGCSVTELLAAIAGPAQQDVTTTIPENLTTIPPTTLPVTDPPLTTQFIADTTTIPPSSPPTTNAPTTTSPEPPDQTTRPPTTIAIHWVEDTYTCEQDALLQLVQRYNGFSSPMALYYDSVENRVYVIDMDEVAGNLYYFDPATMAGIASRNFIAGLADWVYTGKFDPQYRRIYAAGKNTGGLKVYDMATHTLSTKAFGNDGVNFNRMGIFVLDAQVICHDAIQATLTTFNRVNLALMDVSPNSTGVFGYGSMSNPTTITSMLPFLKGWHHTFKWSDIEPSPGTFNWTAFDNQFLQAANVGIKSTFMIFTGNNAPLWLYSAPYSVPKVVVTGGDIFPYYLNSSYQSRWNNMLTNVRAHIATLPQYASGNIVFMQDATGSTGDYTPWHGDIISVTVNGVPVADISIYNISDNDWDTFCRNAWTTQDAQIKAHCPLIGFMVNTANNGANWEWVRTNLPGTHIKAGAFSHNYSFMSEKYYAAYTQGLIGYVYVRGELDYPPLGQPWWNDHANANTLALVASMLNAGLNQFNISERMYTDNIPPAGVPNHFAYDLFNQFAGKPKAADGFIYFRYVPDINDTARFSVATYGPVIDPAQLAAYTSDYNAIQASSKPADVKQNNITNITIKYSNMARRAAICTAIGAIDNLTQDIKADQYNNDLGCDVYAGSWGLYITQSAISAQANVNHYRSPISATSPMGRYGVHNPQAMFTTSLVNGSDTYTAQVTIWYYDGTAGGIISLIYNNGTANVTAPGKITMQGLGAWASNTITVSDLKGSSFSLSQTAPIVYGMMKLHVTANGVQVPPNTRAISTIPSGPTYMSTQFEMTEVNGKIWVTALSRGDGNIAIYDTAFSQVPEIINVPGILPINGWGNGRFWQSRFYDQAKQKFYVCDSGSSTISVFDAVTKALLKQITFTNLQGKPYVACSFFLDPLTDELYLSYFGYISNTDTARDERYYKMNRDTFDLEDLHYEAFQALVLQSGTNTLWACLTGIPAWDGTPTWNTDGAILKYSH